MTAVHFAFLVAWTLTLSGCSSSSPASAAAPDASSVAPSAKAPPGTQQWTCPMHPTYVADRPGDCPICGMKLIPLKRGGTRSPSDGGAATARPRGMAPVTIDARQRRLIGLRTAEVRWGLLETTIRTSGRVTFDESRLVRVQPRFAGFVEELNADFTGKYVRKGEPLASIYSPELLATQHEYLLARRTRGTADHDGLGASTDGPSPQGDGGGEAGLSRRLAASARARLQLWGVGEKDLETLERTGKPMRSLRLYAPISGYVTAKTALVGSRVGPEQALFDIVDLSRVWVLADVYETDLPRLRLGEAATVTLPYWPGRQWQGRIRYVFPTVDEKTRTVQVRVEIANPRGELKTEMFADVVLRAPPRQALLVPEDAVIATGTRKLVFVSHGQGRLVPRELETGARGRGFHEVLAGLEAGEQVVLGANFLIDSESRLRSAIEAMTADDPAPSGPVPSPGHQHGSEHGEAP